MYIGVLITLGKNKLFSKKVRTIVEDQKCQHFNDSMTDYTFCPHCSTKLQPSTKTIYQNYIESDVEGFINQETYIFNNREYRVYRDEGTLEKATKYFIVMERLQYRNMHTQKYDADVYISCLEEAKKISEVINKSGFNSIATIVDFDDYDSGD